MLPSQTPRPRSRRSNMHRRRGRRPARRPVVFLGLLAAGAAAVWFIGDRVRSGAAAESGESPRAALPAAVAVESIADRSHTTVPSPAERPVKTPTPTAPAAALVEMNDDAPARRLPAAAEPLAGRRTETAASVEPAATLASPPTIRQAIHRGLEEAGRGSPILARRLLSQALHMTGIAPADAAQVRAELAAMNQTLVFGTAVHDGDPFTMAYQIRSGDSLQRIARRLALHVDWRFIRRINGIVDERRIRPGQRLKLITGPFHAVVYKRAFRMDVYMGDGDDGSTVFVTSFPVGLGEHDSTPTGRFKVRQDSKLINPRWTNPRTGEQFSADSPLNPIGERWIGLQGVEPHNQDLLGYGIHGTIEPDSIGRQASMGCVRMRHEDVEIIYELLLEGVSSVLIVE